MNSIIDCFAEAAILLCFTWMAAVAIAQLFTATYNWVTDYEDKKLNPLITLVERVYLKLSRKDFFEREYRPLFFFTVAVGVLLVPPLLGVMVEFKLYYALPFIFLWAVVAYSARKVLRERKQKERRNAHLRD